MSLSWSILIIIGVFVLLAVIEYADQAEKKKIALMSPEGKQKYLEEKKACMAESKRISEYGVINTTMICPHCQAIGKIRTKDVKRKKGVSGGKATAAVLTGGISLLAVGLSRKEETTQAHCDNCKNIWFF